MEERKDDKQINKEVLDLKEILALIKDVYDGGNQIILYSQMRKDEEELLDRAGFKISKMPNNEDYCYATLPEGWKTKYVIGSIDSLFPTLPSYNCDLIDANGNIRGCASYFFPEANINLYNRYGVNCDIVDDIDDEDCCYYIYRVYFGNKKEVLYDAGQITVLGYFYSTDEARREELFKKKNDDHKMLSKILENVEKFADENYPDWRDELAYWDDEQKIK